MSLATDSIFVSAISSNSELMQGIGGRLYSTAIPLADKDIDNVPVPFVIVTFDGLTNDQSSKDDPYESDNDSVNISVELVAATREKLADLAEDIRSTIYNYMMAQDGFEIEDYQFSADAVQFDALKPCYWQTLHYQCDVINDIL